MVGEFSVKRLKELHTAEVLVIDENKNIREFIQGVLKKINCIVRTVLEENIDSAYSKKPDIVLLDVLTTHFNLDSFSIFKKLKAKYPYLPIIMMTKHNDIIDESIKFLNLGAYDYIEKPFTENRLKLVVKRAIENARLTEEHDRLRVAFDHDHELIGSSYQIKQIRCLVAKAAANASRILITGPIGTEKNVIARLIHKQSRMRDQPFFVINPSLLSANLSSIFGSKAQYGNSYTDLQYDTNTINLFNIGTLFIEEVGDLKPRVQAELLTLLHERKNCCNYNKSFIGENLRIISASSKNLIAEIQHNNFCESLYYRLNITSIKVPPLLERKGDIPELCYYFIKNICNKMGMPLREISDKALAIMQAYNWPGNVYQLKNVIEWLLIMHPVKVITDKDLPLSIISETSIRDATEVISFPLKEARGKFEKEYLKNQLSRFNGNISKTAIFIGMERSALHRKLKVLGLCDA